MAMQGESPFLDDPNNPTLKPQPVGPPVVAPGASDPTVPQPTTKPVTPVLPPAPVPGATPPPPAWTTDPQYAGMDPALKKIYMDAGQTPAGQGTGFADWQYWNDKPSQFNRLASDIAGTGSDQTTGTPWGAGAWQGSGVGASIGGGAGPTMGSTAPFDVQAFLNGYQPKPNPQATALFDKLMGIGNGSLNVSPSDPIIAAQTDAYRAEADRGAKDAVSAAAERGGALGNVDAISRSASEKAGQATAGFQAQAMGNELQARRTEIMQALSGASGLLTSEQQMQLQEELAAMDAALNESQFGRNLAEQSYQYDTTTNNNLFGA